MLKVDFYFGEKSDDLFGINKFKLELYSHILDKEIDKKKISYNLPKLFKRFFKFIDFITFSPISVLKNRRKDAIAFIMSHTEGYLLNYFKFKKSIIFCYDIVPYLFGGCNFFTRKKLNYSYKAMKKANIILVPANGVKNDLIKYFKILEDKIKVVYGGFDYSLYKLLPKDNEIKKKYNIPEDKKIILCVMSEEPRKDFPTLIKSFAKLKKKLSDIVLVKVGKARKKGEREKNLQLIKDLEIDKDIIFTGYVPEEDLPKFYNMADVYVLPAFYDGGFVLPLVEAMACGCPIISTDNFEETVEDAGILFNETNVDDLTKNMYNILTDIGLKKKLIKKGLERARLFTWNKAAQETVKILKELDER